jgi:hypothetical protein
MRSLRMRGLRGRANALLLHGLIGLLEVWHWCVFAGGSGVGAGPHEVSGVQLERLKAHVPYYNMPVLPTDVDPEYDPKRPIPLHVYVTLRDPMILDDEALGRMIRLNHDCKFHLYGDHSMTEFMDTVFNNTSVQWAFHMINPRLMAARADIWRLAVLWYYGGIYIDADARLNKHIATSIFPSDRFIYGTEKEPYGNCYSPNFHLNQTSTASFGDGLSVINWLLMSSPRHPFLAETLRNIVDVTKRQYFGRPNYLSNDVLHRRNDKASAHYEIVCSTGPGILSASMSKVISSGQYYQSHLQPRYAGMDWNGFARWKVTLARDYSGEDYYVDLIRAGAPFLRRYAKDHNPNETFHHYRHEHKYTYVDDSYFDKGPLILDLCPIERAASVASFWRWFLSLFGF